MARSSFLLAAVLVVALALLTPGVEAMCKCKTANEAVGPCQVSLDVCGCVHRFHWKVRGRKGMERTPTRMRRT